MFEAAKDPKEIIWYKGGVMTGHVPPLSLLFTELRKFLEKMGIGNWE